MNHSNLQQLAEVTEELKNIVANFQKFHSGDQSFTSSVQKQDTGFAKWYFSEGQVFNEFSSFRYLEEFYDKFYACYNSYFEEVEAPVKKSLFSDGVAKKQSLLEKKMKKTTEAAEKLFLAIDIFTENVERSKIIDKATGNVHAINSKNQDNTPPTQKKLDSKVTASDADISKVDNKESVVVDKKNEKSLDNIEKPKLKNSQKIDGKVVDSSKSSEVKVSEKVNTTSALLQKKKVTVQAKLDQKTSAESKGFSPNKKINTSTDEKVKKALVNVDKPTLKTSQEIEAKLVGHPQIKESIKEEEVKEVDSLKEKSNLNSASLKKKEASSNKVTDKEAKEPKSLQTKKEENKVNDEPEDEIEKLKRMLQEDFDKRLNSLE